MWSPTTSDRSTAKSSKTAVIHSVMPGMLALATPQHAASHSFHARLRKDIFEHGAQICFRCLSAHAQSFDGSTLPAAHNFAIGDNGGARIGAAAVNSQNYAHDLLAFPR